MVHISGFNMLPCFIGQSLVTSIILIDLKLLSKTTAIYAFFEQHISPERQKGKSKLSCNMIDISVLILFSRFICQSQVTSTILIDLKFMKNHRNLRLF